MMEKPAAILLVSGGAEPAASYWLRLCLRQIERHTRPGEFMLFIWNNNTNAPGYDDVLRLHPRLPVFTLAADPNERLRHPHAVPLQRLYEAARAKNYEYMITLDSDAFPVRDHWLPQLTGQLNENTPLAGVWRDELQHAITPYIHPSCLCVAASFIERNGLRFDDVDISPDIKRDTLSAFTQCVFRLNRSVYKLRRSNKHQLHYILGGLYGDMIYHHGAGTRKDTLFWGEIRNPRRVCYNNTLNVGLQNLLFNHTRHYLHWLSRRTPPPDCLFPGYFQFRRQLRLLEKKAAALRPPDGE